MNTSNKNDLEYEILPENQIHYDLSFKLIVIGDCAVGKSCLSAKATKNIFENDYKATLGFEYFTFTVKLDSKIIRLEIWDTCGQELYRSLITNFYHNTSLALIVYAIDKKSSFESISSWLNELRTNSNPDIKLFLIGNKNDLENQRQIGKAEGELFAKNNGFQLFLESSAKTGFNAQQIFIDAAKILYTDYQKYHKEKDKQRNENLLKKKIDYPSEKNKCEC